MSVDSIVGLAMIIVAIIMVIVWVVMEHGPQD